MKLLTDSAIVELYWDRDEEAIAASDAKYGACCRGIACNILDDRQEAEECVNDTWLQAWEAIPPQRPVRLGAFLGRITRNAAFDRRRHALAIKRGGGERLAVLDELAECVSGGEGVEEETARRELAAAISAFLESLPREKRAIFVLRYWYGESVTDIAAKCHRKPNAVSTLLWRLRKAMKRYLTERGFDL